MVLPPCDVFSPWWVHTVKDSYGECFNFYFSAFYQLKNCISSPFKKSDTMKPLYVQLEYVAVIGEQTHDKL